MPQSAKRKISLLLIAGILAIVCLLFYLLSRHANPDESTLRVAHNLATGNISSDKKEPTVGSRRLQPTTAGTNLTFTKEDYEAADNENAVKDWEMAMSPEVLVGPILHLPDGEDPTGPNLLKIITLVNRTDTNSIVGLMRMRYDNDKGYYVPAALEAFGPLNLADFPPVSVANARTIIVSSATLKGCVDATFTSTLVSLGDELDPYYQVVCVEKGVTPLFVRYINAFTGDVVVPSTDGMHRIEAEPLGGQ